MPRLRVGVALLLEPPVADEVNGLRRALGDPSLARVPPHITLVPPVNVRAEQMGAALAALRAAASAGPRTLDLTLGRPDTFLPANPVLHLPVGGDVAALLALRDRVFVPPLARSLTWPFVPHVTLADDADPDRVVAAASVLADYLADVAIGRVHLLHEVRDGPPRWQPLADVEFGPASIVSRGGPLAVELVRSRMVDPEGMALVPAGVGPAPDMVITARREGAVVGVARAWLTPDGGRCHAFVAPGHRRQGLGRHLGAALQAAVNDAGWGITHLQPEPRECQAKGMDE